jgi:hypothetical protein
VFECAKVFPPRTRRNLFNRRDRGPIHRFPIDRRVLRKHGDCMARMAEKKAAQGNYRSDNWLMFVSQRTRDRPRRAWMCARHSLVVTPPCSGRCSTSLAAEVQPANVRPYSRILPSRAAFGILVSVDFDRTLPPCPTLLHQHSTAAFKVMTLLVSTSEHLYDLPSAVD